MYSAIFSLRLLCAIYIGSVVWFNVRQAKIPLFTQKRNRRPGDKTIRTTFPTRANKPDKSDGGPASTPNRQSNPNDHPDRTKTYRTSQAKTPSRPTKTPLRFRSDETVRTTGSNRSNGQNGPDRLNERPDRRRPRLRSNDTTRHPRPDAFSPTAGRTGRRILSPHKPESRNGRRLSRTVATSSAYKYTAPDINDIDSRRNAATNAAPQTTTKCGWPVRIHRDTGPVAPYPEHDSRTVRYRIT